MGSAAAPTILVVDDDPGVRDALHVILDDDYDVIDAADGDEALAVLASKKIDLVLLDLVMEHTDGFAVLERRRGEHRNVPIVVLSGLNNAWTASAAARLGAVDYVTKPFDEDHLRALVRDTLFRPAPAPGGARAPRARNVLVVGVGLGVYASLVVLLGEQCRVARAETIADALGSSESLSVDVLVIDPASLGLQGAAILPRLRQQFSNTELVLIDAGGRPPTGPRVTELLAEIRSCLASSRSGSRRYSARVGSILDHLGTHYVEASVRRLARAIGASPSHLSACFRDETGLPLKAYMTELRIAAAKWLFLEVGEKLDAVAQQVGLHDGSHLSKLFVRHTGRRPGAYRKSVHSGDTLHPETH
jgi:DNA-binding response OmpR family regulator/AraC-like DNA-binding protein